MHQRTCLPTDVNFRKCSLHSECVKKDTYPETSHPNTERNIKPHLKDSCSTRPCLIFLFSPHRSDVGVKSFDLGGKIWSRHVSKYSENRVADHRNRKAQGCTHWEGREERALFKTAQFFIFMMLASICSHLYQNLVFFLRAKTFEIADNLRISLKKSWYDSGHGDSFSVWSTLLPVPRDPSLSPSACALEREKDRRGKVPPHKEAFSSRSL